MIKKENMTATASKDEKEESIPSKTRGGEERGKNEILHLWKSRLFPKSSR